MHRTVIDRICSAVLSGTVGVAACVLTALALITFAATPHGQTPDDLASAGRSGYGRFVFSRGTCELGGEFCAIATPRDWAPAELDIVRGALDQITATDVGRRVVGRALGNGFRTLRRFTTAAQPDESGRYEEQPAIVAAAHTDAEHGIRTIDLTDRFFERGTARDHFSGDPGYLLTTEILAHELVHAMDLDQQYSATAEFRRIARLGMPIGQQRTADRVNAQREELDARREYEASWQASRSFGVLTMHGRLPSVQALDGYREAFAEFGADLILDPYARRRLEPRVLRYFADAIESR